jgi:hypothetical protein
MSQTLYDTYTPCSQEKALTCKWRRYKCGFCNQTTERQGLRIFADNNIQNYYEADPKLVENFKREQKKNKKTLKK